MNDGHEKFIRQNPYHGQSLLDHTLGKNFTMFTTWILGGQVDLPTKSVFIPQFTSQPNSGITGVSAIFESVAFALPLYELQFLASLIGKLNRQFNRLIHYWIEKVIDLMRSTKVSWKSFNNQLLKTYKEK
jgi:hypothetical protein